MSIRYYDHGSGTFRFKRRYIWGLWGYLIGVASAVVLSTPSVVAALQLALR